MKTTTTRPAIRLTVTKEVGRALSIAKKRYPALSDPEILKLGLSKIVTSHEVYEDEQERKEIMALASNAVGHDYLKDSTEDIYNLDMGKKVHFE